MATASSRRLRSSSQQAFATETSTAATCTWEKRRERKRLTDRQAQREHRKRKKQHIDELEARIEFLTQNNGSSQVSALLKENEELRKELQNLKSLVDSIQDLITLQQPCRNDQPASTNNPSAPQNNTQIDAASTASVQATALQVSNASTPVSDMDLETHATGADVQALVDRHDGQTFDGDQTGGWALTHSDGMVFPESAQVHIPCIEGSAMAGAMQSDALAATAFSADGLIQPVDVDMNGWSQATEKPRIIPDHVTGSLSAMMGCGTAEPWDIDHFHDTTLLDHDLAASRQQWLGPWSTYPSAGSLESYSQGPLVFPSEVSALSMLVSRPSLHGRLSAGAPLSQDYVRPEQKSVQTTNSYRQRQQLPAKPSWLCLPALLSPAMPTDSALQEFILECTGAHCGRPLQKLRKPAILDFLTDDPSNRLSRAVKQYLSPIRVSMELSEQLACYWIISLLMRWHINQDEESFGDLPTWLRPTVLQTRVTHPLTVCFMPWPLLRDNLILTTFSNLDAVPDVMVALGKHMKVDLTLTRTIQKVTETDTALFNSPPGLDDVLPSNCLPQQISSGNQATTDHSGTHLDPIGEALGDLRNWRLHDSFFLQFPEFRNVYEQSLGTLPGNVERIGLAV